MSARNPTEAELQVMRWLAGEATGSTATRHVMERLAEIGYVEGGPGERRLTDLGREHLSGLRRRAE